MDEKEDKSEIGNEERERREDIEEMVETGAMGAMGNDTVISDTELLDAELGLGLGEGEGEEKGAVVGDSEEEKGAALKGELELGASTNARIEPANEEPITINPPWSLPNAPSPEVRAGFFSILSVWWLTPLMALGYKRPLKHTDLYPLIDKYTAESIYDRFERNWSVELEKAPKESGGGNTEKTPSTPNNGTPNTTPVNPPNPPPPAPSPSLLHALFATFGRLFVTAGVFRFFGDACSLASPVVLRYLLEVVAGGGQVPGRGKPFGYIMAAVMFILQLTSTLCSNAYLNRSVRTGFSVRTSLITSIYNKTLKLSQAARAEFTAGKTVNLMAVDASRLDSAAWQLHSLWAAPMTVIVAMSLLIAQLGPSALVGMALLLTLLPLQALLMRHLMGLRRQTNQLTDKRVRMTQETIAGIRVVKLLGWEQAMESHLGQVRTEELVNVRTIGNWRAYMTGITFIQPILASVLTFVVYSLTGHPLSPPIVFSSIALFNTLRMPLMMLPMVITNTTDAWVSLQRIKAMLLAPELGGDMVGRPEEKGKVELKDGEFEWEPPVKVLPDAPKGKRGAGRGGPSGGPNSTTMTARSGVTASAAAAASAEASGLQHTMRRGAYGATITPFSTTNQDQGISGWMRRTFRTTPTRGGVPPSATEMAAKRAVRAVGEPKVPAIDAVPFTGLHSMNLTVLPGELLAIVGRVGSGKSSLLSALVGEMKRTRGTGGIGGTVSFCPQSPWIQNATLRDNVLFGLPFDETKYWNAIRCAALERDLEILPDGDATEIGERGITLSGGQKARVSLARAVYADTDVVLLDDPLSAVDANVGRHLFEKCITGVLVSKTRILVTHQIHVLPGCDRIICLDNGTIVQQGTYAELMVDKEGYLNKIMTEYGGAGDADADDSSEGGASSSEDATTAAGESAPAGEVKGEFGKSAAAGGGSGKDKAAAGKGVGAPPGGGGSNPTTTTGKALMTVEERNAGAVKAGIYWKWIKFAGGIWFLTSVLFLLLAMQGTKVGTDTWLAQWSVNAYPNLTLATYMTVYVVLGILQGFCAVGFGLLLSFQGRLASKRMHETALGHVLHAPTSFFDQTPVGRIMNRFSKDIDAMDNTLPETWRMFLMTVSTTISTLVLISIVQPIFIAVMVPLMVVYYFAQAYYRSTARELKRLDSISRSPLFANFGETLTGLSTIRAFNASARFVKKNLAMLNYNNRAYYITLMIPRWLSIRLESISACLVFTISMLAVGTASPTAQAGLLSLAVTYSLQLTATMNWLTRQASETEVQMNGVERLLYYVDELEQEAPAEIPETKPAPTWPSKGEIDFKNLVVRYRPDLPAVLCGINVSVKPGERVGIVGRTGAGKSTIMTSLFRLVEASEGSIVIDGVDIGKIGLHDVRSKLSIIPQDPILFSGTVRYNLDPFSEFSDADIWDCLTRAGDMASVISGLPEKLEAPVAENGDNFSIGQRSLLCLARAMLRQSRIVVLDEATASVDMATDELIQKTIRTDERFKGRTILTIAHRLYTVMDYDRILVMDHGKVVQFDTPANLVAQPGPLRSLVDETGPTNAEVLIKLAQRGPAEANQ